ncbi:transcriptional regulator GcvA [Paralimibaculum aggregatum]|uniref:Transcriptional regulator GcvA n=1 Tax=Paralimibaculum aggregatum TaxID=3036245 RepID=A0ABQ6LG74_9RHOB|nr:LysR family transcriptional regulator [Limibaculum sp. NKW23]GMG82323.1 transcriptional regulator GcvA [Limibaculum sp. NKW23]
MDWSGLPPLSQLRAFETTARTGGFSAAGRELNVTHAAVAQQVRGLERHLGVGLVRREGRGLALTPEGARLAEALGAGFETMRAALAEILAEQAARPVHITLTPAFLAAWLMPRLGEFRAAHPKIELMLNPSTDVVDLARSGHDLAIRFGTGDWPGLEAIPLVAAPVVVVAAPALLAACAVREPADLLALPWVQEIGTDELAVWLRGHGVEIAGKTDILHLPGKHAIDAILRGDGAGMTARIFVEEDIAAGRLVALFDRDRDASGTGYHLVRRPGRQRPDVQKVAGWLLRLARRG